MHILYVHSHEKRISAILFPNGKYRDLSAKINQIEDLKDRKSMLLLCTIITILLLCTIMRI